jgi:hypothetical protein
MNEYNDNIDDLDLALALRRLAGSTNVPPVDPAREAALMAAFDAPARGAVSAPRTRLRRPYWGMAGLAAAAALLIAVVLSPVRAGRHGTLPTGEQISHTSLPSSSSRGVQPEPVPGEFFVVPGAASLPGLESGSLVRMDLPVSMLPSLGVTPPGGLSGVVKADLIVGQDGLPRAVRLLN